MALTPTETPLALVTGGAGGIGAACCRQLAGAGYSVLIHYRRSEAAAAKLVEELTQRGNASTHPIRVHTVQADLSHEDGLDTVCRRVKELGGLDALINNAGVGHSRPMALTSLEDYQRVMAINVTSVWYLCKRMALMMVRKRSGRIVNISSVVGSTGNSMQTVYGMSKAAIDNLTKSLAQELAPYGVLVNAVCPGLIDTQMLDGLTEEATESLLKQIALGRKGSADEVARLVRFLVTEGSYCTGGLFPIHGGLLGV